MKTITDHIDMFPRVLLIGPPGVGKSYAARDLLRKYGDPMQTIMHQDLIAQELLGTFMPKGAELVWTDGPIVQAVRNKLPLIIDELDKASPATFDLFTGLLENPSRLALPTGECVSSEIHIWATTNSLDGINDALLSRLEYIETVSRPTPSLVQHLNGLANRLGDVVYDSWADPKNGIDVRKALFFTRLATAISPGEAAKCAFGPKGESILRSIKLHPGGAPSETAKAKPQPDPVPSSASSDEIDIEIDLEDL